MPPVAAALRKRLRDVIRDITAKGALPPWLSFPGLASAHESQPHVEGAALAPAVCQEVRRIDIVINNVRIAIVGEII